MAIKGAAALPAADREGRSLYRLGLSGRDQHMAGQTGAVWLPCSNTVSMLLRALMASGQIQMRKTDGWETLAQPFVPISRDLAA